MSIQGGDRGETSTAVLAPIVAALLGGAAAILLAFLVIGAAPSTDTELTGDVNTPQLQYGSR